MSARIRRKFVHAGHTFYIYPRLNLSDNSEVVRSSIHHLGGMISPVIVHRLGAYLGQGI